LANEAPEFALDNQTEVPKLYHLTAASSLCQQVAQFLSIAEEPGTLLITPTAGAARSVVNCLDSTKSQSLVTGQPMQVLLPEREDIATPIERCLAWAKALRNLPESKLSTLFWKERPQTTTELLKAGRNFNGLCDRLAEAGLSPSTFQLSELTSDLLDQGRWSAIAALYLNYISCLARWSLRDPNDLRLDQIKEPTTAPSRIVIAGVSDLPFAFQLYAKQIEKHGITVDVLIWNPRNVSESSFDDWGRPITEFWNSRQIDLSKEQIHVSTSAQDEVRNAVQVCVQNNTKLVAVDPKLHLLLASEILSRGHRPYLPEGVRLIDCEAAKLALDWEEFRQEKDLRCLRRLLELPSFCSAVDTDHPLSQSDALIAIDHLLGKTIASTLDAAWKASPSIAEAASEKDRRIRGKTRRLLGSIRARLDVSALGMIEAAFPDESTRPKSAKRVLEIGRKLEKSPALMNWIEGSAGSKLPVQIFTQAISREQLQVPSIDEVITLNGWLEAPWLPEAKLMLCGIIEGQLPQSLDGDPFLPDSICPALSLSHNEQRLARDAYLLDALLATHSADDVCLSFSKYNKDGDPNKPSRLLFRTKLEELPLRVQQLSQSSESSRIRPRRQTEWRWQLTDEIPSVIKISPTQFESYLSCPFRFCLEKVLKYTRSPKATYEMDAAAFGNLIHNTLENFGREIIPTDKAMLDLDESTIRQRVQQLLEQQALLQFGTQPTPAVQVQLASAVVRLHAFARIQAQCFTEGWIIRDVERKLEVDGDTPLAIGSLQLSGTIDRIEQNATTGALRVIDYKTFSSVKKPAQTHFAPASHSWLPAAQVEVLTSRGVAKRAWKNLQLPLYRKILENWYPKVCAKHLPETAYFVLPSDPNESGIYPFNELSEELYVEAINCAEAVTRKITDGHFWPPQAFRGSWDDPFAPLFVNGAIENCIAPETIKKLKGGLP
jgi:ATP-dependent helicase/nuclease subunit B